MISETLLKYKGRTIRITNMGGIWYPVNVDGRELGIFAKSGNAEKAAKAHIHAEIRRQIFTDKQMRKLHPPNPPDQGAAPAPLHPVVGLRKEDRA
jgi:hypothetical protein